MASQIEQCGLENLAIAAQNDGGSRGVTPLKKLTWLIWSSMSLAAAALAGNSTPGSGHKIVYEWVDDHGVTHYGDQIPPEYISREHKVFNDQGVEIGHMDAQKSPEQLAEEDRKRADAQQRASRDRNLLNSYVSVQEIEHLRDQRLALLTDQIRVTGQFLDSLNKKMSTLRDSSAHFRPYSSDPNAPPMSDQLAEDLVHVNSDMLTQEGTLKEKRSEAEALSRQFDSDIARFKELKGIH